MELAIDEIPIDLSLSKQRLNERSCNLCKNNSQSSFMTTEPQERFQDFSEIELLIKQAENIIEQSLSSSYSPPSQNFTQRRSMNCSEKDLFSSSLLAESASNTSLTTIDFGPLDDALNNASILLESFSQNTNDIVDSLIDTLNSSNSTESIRETAPNNRFPANVNNLSMEREQDDDCVFVSAEIVSVVDLCTPGQDKRSRRRTNRLRNLNLDDSVILIDDVAPIPEKKLASSAPLPPEKPKTKETKVDEPIEIQNKPVVICSVCMDSVFNNQPATTICGHIFCMPCISTSIRVNKKCPLCNRSLNKKNFHRIYF